MIVSKEKLYLPLNLSTLDIKNRIILVVKNLIYDKVIDKDRSKGFLGSINGATEDKELEAIENSLVDKYAELGYFSTDFITVHYLDIPRNCKDLFRISYKSYQTIFEQATKDYFLNRAYSNDFSTTKMSEYLYDYFNHSFFILDSFKKTNTLSYILSRNRELDEIIVENCENKATCVNCKCKEPDINYVLHVVTKLNYMITIL